MHRGRLFATVTIVASAALGPLVAAPAGANHSWGGYHWASGAPKLTVSLGDNVSGVWDGLLTTTSGQWSTTHVDTAVTAGASDAACSPVAGRVEVCNGAYGENGWLGIATVWFDANGHIGQGTVRVNDSYFLTPTYDDDTARLHVMCQEVGHTLGLDHQHRPMDRSCMNDSWGLFSTDYDQPNQHDYDQLDTVYAHDDTAPGGGGGGSCKNPRKCARGQDGGREEHVFVTHLPDGRTKVTWVTPA